MTNYFLGFVCMSFALPLCPPGRIEEALQLMRDEVANMSPSISAFSEEFLGYIQHTYLGGNFGNLEDGYEWNGYDRIEEGFLTNNTAEGANNRLFKRAGRPHPGFYRFCGLMKEEMENVKNKAEQFEQGILLPPKRTSRTTKVAQNRINMKEMLERGQTSLRKYLRTLGRMHQVIKGRARRGGNQAADSILRGALESVTEPGQEESAPVRGRGRARGARGGRMRRARGARGRGNAPLYR